MPNISIIDLEVFYRVGVPDEERAKPQKLLLAIEMELPFAKAVRSDSIADTIDYFAVSQRLLRFGDGKNWKLIEKLATDICEMILTEFKPQSVTVEVKKFPVPQARYVSVSLTKERSVYAEESKRHGGGGAGSSRIQFFPRALRAGKFSPSIVRNCQPLLFTKIVTAFESRV